MSNEQIEAITMTQHTQQLFTGERALFGAQSLEISHSVFFDGESPLKESTNIHLKHDIFKWKYPLWYCKHIRSSHLTLTEDARSGIWYTKDITIADSLIQAPKTFRRSEGIQLTNVELPNAIETLWHCKNIKMVDVSVHGDYFGMNCENIEAEGLSLSGNYAFDGAKDIYLSNVTLLSKDAFWNCENVTVENSTIIGEYLGWNSKSITFINCTIESSQGMCYMENVKLINCTVIHTDLAFEYSTVEVKTNSIIESIKNPIHGVVEAEGINEVIFDDPEIHSERTVITIKASE